MALAAWHDLRTFADVFTIGGWAEVHVTDAEARAAFARDWPGQDGYARHVQGRLLPFLLLSQPGHESPGAWG